MWEVHERDVRSAYVWGVCVRMHCSASVYVKSASVWVIVQMCERGIFWLILFPDHFPPPWWKMVWEQDYLLLCQTFTCVERVWYQAYSWISHLGIYFAFIYTHSKLWGLSSNHRKWCSSNRLFWSLIGLYSWLQHDKSVYIGLIPDPPPRVHVWGPDYIFEQLVYFQNPYIHHSDKQSLDLLVYYDEQTVLIMIMKKKWLMT